MTNGLILSAAAGEVMCMIMRSEERRVGKECVHDYDIVEGPMVDDTIWDYVNEFFADRIDRETFWLNVLDKQPAIQLSFHTLSAIDCLTYEGSEQVVGENG